MFVLNYAKALIAGISSTQYGQSGHNFVHDGLTPDQASAVNTVMMHAMMQASAKDDKDEALADYHRNQIDWRINRAVKFFGMNPEELREAAKLANDYVVKVRSQINGQG